MEHFKIMTRYFEIKPILEKSPTARYYFLLGGRSTGKTYPTIQNAIGDALDGKGLFAYVRRHRESLQTANIAATFSVHDKFIDEHTQGRWNHIAYYQRRSPVILDRSAQCTRLLPGRRTRAETLDTMTGSQISSSMRYYQKQGNTCRMSGRSCRM